MNGYIIFMKGRPPLLCRIGAKTTRAKNPYTTEGMAARISIIPFFILTTKDKP